MQILFVFAELCIVRRETTLLSSVITGKKEFAYLYLISMCPVLIALPVKRQISHYVIVTTHHTHPIKLAQTLLDITHQRFSYFTITIMIIASPLFVPIIVMQIFGLLQSACFLPTIICIFALISMTLLTFEPITITTIIANRT